MDQLRDFDVDKPPEDPESPPPNYPWRLVAVGVVIVLAIVGYLVMTRQSTPSGPSDTTDGPRPSTTTPSAAKPLGQEGDALVLPPLDETDSLVRTLVEGLSSHPTIVAWLATDNLIRTFTAATHNVAAGVNPTAHARRIAPAGPFRVVERDGGAFIDPRSYARYDRIADAVASVDSTGAARVYGSLKPRIEEAHAELGAGGTFDASLERAIVVLLQTPIVEGPVPLEHKGVGYGFADPRLEALTPPQKQLLRMGPRNVRLIQAKLRDIAHALGIPDERLPPDRAAS